jgi:CMP-N-acetylneuraminic acid synthetase
VSASGCTVQGVNPRLVGVVPVRAGSRGLPGKNTRLLRGKPLYRHAVDLALNAGLGEVWITTDIEEILTAPLPARVRLRRRPADLADDHTQMADVLGDFVDVLEGPATIILLQATTPMRQPEQVEDAVARFVASGAELLMSVVEAPRESLKWGTVDDGWFSPMRSADHTFSNRQDLPDVVKPNGAIYVFDADWFRARRTLATERILAFEMDAETSIDIDTIRDFERAEQLLDERESVNENR